MRLNGNSAARHARRTPPPEPNSRPHRREQPCPRRGTRHVPRVGHYASHAWNTICLTRGTPYLPCVGLYRDDQDCQDTQDCQDRQDIAVLEVLEVLVVLASPPSHEIFSGPLAPRQSIAPYRRDARARSRAEAGLLDAALLQQVRADNEADMTVMMEHVRT